MASIASSDAGNPKNKNPKNQRAEEGHGGALMAKLLLQHLR